jgi:hypothetical protein
VVGEPIPLAKEPSASKERVNEVLELYKVKLRELFDTHKEAYLPNGKDATLEFV